MATANPFDLLGDDENDDPSQLIAAQLQKIAAAPKKPAATAAAPPAAAKLPSKPVPPAQAAREARSNTAPIRGGAGRGGFGRGRGGRGVGTGPNPDLGNGNASEFSGGYGGGGGAEDDDASRALERERGAYSAPRQQFRGGRRGGYGNGEAGGDYVRPPRRMYERHSGTGRGHENKRDGEGRGNWGGVTEDAIAQETEVNVEIHDKIAAPEKQPEQEDASSSEVSKDVKESPTNEAEEKEKVEDKEMTLDEYEKIREEKRKALLALKAEERKVDFDKEFESMQQLSLKKGDDEVFIKLGSDKDSGKKKEVDRAKKSVSINEFLKPAEGERYYSPSGRGRGGRGQGDRGSFRGGFGATRAPGAAAAPLIEDPRQFPILGEK